MTELRIQLADTITQLVDPYTHLEVYYLPLRSPVPGGPTQHARTHRTSHASLLQQLRRAVEPSASASNAGGNGYRSTESARLAAIDRLNAIHTQACTWTHRLGGQPRATTADTLRALPGYQPTPHNLTTDATRWLTWAQIVTAWEIPPRTLREPCPLCSRRGAIKVVVDPVKAWCTNPDCNQTWSDDAEIAILAQHVRACNGELTTQETINA